MIRSGDLRIRATVQRRIETANDSGGQAVDYETWQVLPCKNVSTQSRQLRDAQRLETTATHAFQFRYNENLKPTMRLVIDGVKYHVQSVTDPDMRRRELVVVCEAEQANG